MTYGHGLHLTNLLDLVASRCDFKALKDGLDLGLRELPLLRRQCFSGLGLHRALKNNLILVVFVEQGLLVVNRARGDLHLERMLLSILLNLLEMFVVTVLSEPSDDITFRPIDLQCVLVLVVDVVLERRREPSFKCKRSEETYIDGHLIDMDPLLDTELGDVYIEGGVKDTYDLCLANDGPVTLGQIVNQEAEEEMSRLLLSQSGRVLFTVALCQCCVRL